MRNGYRTRGDKSIRVVVGLAAASVVGAALIAAAYLVFVRVDETNLLTLMAPDGVSTFAVEDSRGNTVWFISATPAREVSSLRYGELPTGFHQGVPIPPAQPRPLVKGESVTLKTETPTLFKEHRCEVTGPASVFCGAYTQGPVIVAQPK